MGQFWEAATEQAGRRFGDRYWRWFAGVRVARRVAPLVATAVILGALVLAYRWLAPDWAGIGSSVVGHIPSFGGWAIVWILVGVAALAVAVGVAAWIRRNSWRWWTLNRPMWMRRY